MISVEKLSDEFSGAFSSIVNTRLFYKDNDISLLQAGLILLLPQMTGYLLQYNKKFGIDIGVSLDGYPLLLFVVLTVSIYVMLDTTIVEKTGDVVYKISFLSIHIFAFALSINLVYSVVLQIFGAKDIWASQIRNAATLFTQSLSPPVFAAIYSIPFLMMSVALIFMNSRRSYMHNSRNLSEFIGTGIFWRSLVLVMVLAIYQYMAFILVGASAV